MCGAVSFEASIPKRELHACHCGMCRRWTGSAMVAVNVPATEMRIEGGGNVRVIRSSEWAERAWRDRCGSNLWYRLTVEGPTRGSFEIRAGLLDEPDGFPLVSEIYIDRKPDGYAFAGEHERQTGAEIEATIAAYSEGEHG